MIIVRADIGFIIEVLHGGSRSDLSIFKIFKNLNLDI